MAKKLSPQPENEQQPKAGPKNYELGMHYNFNAFRFEGLGHKVQGLLVGGTDHLGNEQWEMLVIVDEGVLARCPYPILKEARKSADRFVKGHLINLITEWAESVS